MINKKNIAIYGLGTETERNLPFLTKKYNIVGLLDGYRTQGVQYGFNILKIEDVIKNIESIIVVARPGSCKVIAKRIGGVCIENNVELVDVRGNNLLQQKEVSYNFNSIVGYTMADLLREINKSDVVSFDLFDTLVMRNICSVMDLIRVVEIRLKEKGVVISEFYGKRIMAEKQLSQGYAPNLKEIYEKVLSESENITLTAEELSEIEFETDFSMLSGRKEMIALVKKCIELNKKVYITTDCYYEKYKVEQILKKISIESVDGILVSSEYGTAKTGRLFEYLLIEEDTKKILHIGDDAFSDIECAKLYGINTFKIYSGEELLDCVGGLGIIKHITNLSDSMKVGMFVANIFNNPFQFENIEKSICVFSSEDIGYLFFAPIIMDFTFWFGEQVKKKDLKNIWFCSRDGYLIKKLFEYIYPCMKSEYFLISRISAIRAGVSSKDDIAYVDSMKYSGKLEDNLLKRFGIKATMTGKDTNNEGLLRYKDIIIETAEKKRTNNLKYIESLNVQEGGIAFFDFVAKGSSQMFMQRMIHNKIYGLYFLQLEPEFMADKHLDIVPFYTDEEKNTSIIYDNYYILETFLTSPEPSIEEFNENGKALYAEETRDDESIECIMKVQNGIIQYTKGYSQMCPISAQGINKKLDEALLELIHKVKILNSDFLNLQVEDPFFNRITGMIDLL